MQFNRWRYYSAAIGRWISQDPVSFAGGTNLYGFVRNNPIRNRDPEGRAILPPITLVLAGLYYLTEFTAFGVDMAEGCNQAAIGDTFYVRAPGRYGTELMGFIIVVQFQKFRVFYKLPCGGERYLDYCWPIGDPQVVHGGPHLVPRPDGLYEM